MSSQWEPLTSAKVFSTDPALNEKNFGLLRFPLACSPKLDGIRLTEYQGVMHTRSLKLPRNRHVRASTTAFVQRAAQLGYSGMDGEVVAGSSTDANAMQNTTSGIMSAAGTPDFGFYMFDLSQNASDGFLERYARARQLHALLQPEFPWLHLLEQVIVHNLAELLAYEAKCLALGYEGIMLRSLNGRYKLGRSTMQENILMALKRFVDDEALVLEFREEVENANVAFTNELGRTARSSHQENLIPKGRMGTMLCKSALFKPTFWLGGGKGITHDWRKRVWENSLDFQWRVAGYTYQDIGVLHRPRLPKWRVWRSWDDLDPAKAKQLAEYGAAWVFGGTGLPGVLPASTPPAVEHLLRGP